MFHSNSRHSSLFLLILFLFAAACSKADDKYNAGSLDFKASGLVKDEWMEAFYQGKKIGYIHSTTDEGTLGVVNALRVKSFARIEMEIEGEKSHTELDHTGYIDDKGGLLAFDYRQEIMNHTLSVRGERRSDKLFVEVDSGGDRRKREFPWHENLYTSALLKQALLKRGLREGDNLEFDVILEPLLAVEKVNIKVVREYKGFIEGKETTIYTLEESFKGITGDMTITSYGDTLEEVSPNGFRLLRAAKEEALEAVQPLSITDLISDSLIKVDEPPRNPRSLKTLRLKLKNVPSVFPVIEDHHQKIIDIARNNGSLDYTFDVTVEEPGGADVAFPVRDSAYDLYLKADHVVNSDNELIVKKSKGIIGNERSAAKAAFRIYDWVNRNIKKRLIDTVSAVDTLKSGEGECQAHANLFAALARAAGIPAKVISGIVYSEEFGGFVYHAWNEVWLGRWVSVDSALGGFPADATHLKLAEGGLEEQLRIMALIGSIKVEILGEDKALAY